MKKSLVLIISVVAIIAAATVIISASGISDAIYRHRKDKDNMENSVGKLVDDIKLLLMTFKIVFVAESTEGVEDEENDYKGDLSDFIIDSSKVNF